MSKTGNSKRALEPHDLKASWGHVRCYTAAASQRGPLTGLYECRKKQKKNWWWFALRDANEAKALRPRPAALWARLLLLRHSKETKMMLSFETKAILRKCNFFHRHLSRPFGPVQLLALLVLDPASTTLKSFLVLWRLFLFHFTFLHQNVYAWVASSLLTTSLSIVNKEFNFIRIGILGITIWEMRRSKKHQKSRKKALS